RRSGGKAPSTRRGSKRWGRDTERSHMFSFSFTGATVSETHLLVQDGPPFLPARAPATEIRCRRSSEACARRLTGPESEFYLLSPHAPGQGREPLPSWRSR